MQKTIEPVNFNASQDLISRIDEMFDDLPKYNDSIVSADIYLEAVQKTEEDNKKIKIKVFLPGHEIFMDEEATDFVTAAQGLYDRVKRHLRDLKEKDKNNRQQRPDKVI